MVDLESLGCDAILKTSYKRRGSAASYDAAYSHWGVVASRDEYRITWRSMAATKDERTLISAIIPPGPAHLSQSLSLGGFAMIGRASWSWRLGSCIL